MILCVNDTEPCVASLAKCLFIHFTFICVHFLFKALCMSQGVGANECGCEFVSREIKFPALAVVKLRCGLNREIATN